MISTKPEETFGRASKSKSSFSFPKDDGNLTKATFLQFTKYSRESPNDSASEATTLFIQLPLPIQIPENNTIKINSADLGIWGNDIKQLYETGLSAAKDALSAGLPSNFDNTLNSLAKGLALAPGIADSSRGQFSSAEVGVVRNPHTTALFEGVNLRSWTLSWKLSPRNLQESNELMAIIDNIRIRIHPEIVAGGFALDYPDLLYVTFNGTNGYLPKIRKSFIQSMMVAPALGTNAFYSNGAPVETELTLSLMETEIITRDELLGTAKNRTSPLDVAKNVAGTAKLNLGGT